MSLHVRGCGGGQLKRIQRHRAADRAADLTRLNQLVRMQVRVQVRRSVCIIVSSCGLLLVLW